MEACDFSHGLRSRDPGRLEVCHGFEQGIRFRLVFDRTRDDQSEFAPRCNVLAPPRRCSAQRPTPHLLVKLGEFARNDDSPVAAAQPVEDRRSEERFSRNAETESLSRMPSSA